MFGSHKPLVYGGELPAAARAFREPRPSPVKVDRRVRKRLSPASPRQLASPGKRARPTTSPPAPARPTTSTPDPASSTTSTPAPTDVTNTTTKAESQFSAVGFAVDATTPTTRASTPTYIGKCHDDCSKLLTKKTSNPKATWGTMTTVRTTISHAGK